MLKRKLMAAMLSSVLFTMIFSFPSGFEWDVNFFLNLYFLNLVFVGTYGIAVSILSDWGSRKIFRKKLPQELASFFLHCVFGLIFLLISLTSAALFFIVDRLLQKVTIRWWVAITSFVAVVCVFFWGITFLN